MRAEDVGLDGSVNVADAAAAAEPTLLLFALARPVTDHGNARNVPVAAFGKFFLVLPATK